MEHMESLIPGMSEQEYYAKTFQRTVWRNLSFADKIQSVIEMQKRAAVFLRLRGKTPIIWQG